MSTVNVNNSNNVTPPQSILEDKNPIKSSFWEKSIKPIFDMLGSLFYRPNQGKNEDLISLSSSYSLDTIEEMANEFGYKTANLKALQNTLSELERSLSNCDLKVPGFLGVASGQVKQYLRSRIENFDERLKSFSEMFKAEKTNLLKEECEFLRNLQLDIIEAFSCNNGENIVFEWVKPFLENKNPKELLIVRSTGGEDSDENTNAGGNLSLPFIKSEVKSLSLAIGQVIASYFSEKSILQRLLVKDPSLQKEPILPVLIQNLIYEKNDKEIPRSGVLFTSEKQEADLVVINASLGSNEGVVHSKVAVDSYYVHPYGVDRVIRDKKNRIKQELTPNSEKIRNQSSLPTEVVLDLAKVARKLAKIHGKALDIEFTVDMSRKKPCIYLLQLRPLAKKADVKSFEYIDSQQLQETQEKKKVKVFLEGEGKVIALTSKNDVIFASNLTDALSKYENANDKKAVKVIFINEEGARTSHEAVMLRAAGVTVISQKIEEDFICSLSKGEKWFLSVQQGIIAKRNDCNIKEGQIAYPGLEEYSISHDEVKDVDNLLKDSINWAGGIVKDTYPRFSVRSLLEQIALSEDRNSAKIALARLILHLAHFVHKQKKCSDFKEFALVYKNIFSIAQKRLVPSIDRNKTMDKLYHLKRIESLIFQKTNEKIVNGFSIYGLLADRKIEKEIGKKTTTEVYLERLSSYALSEETKQRWKSVCEKMKTSKEFMGMIKSYYSMGAFPTWLNGVFVKDKYEIKNSINTFAKNKGLLESLQKIEEELEGLSVELWQNPAYCSDQNITEFSSFIEKKMVVLSQLYANSSCEFPKLMTLFTIKKVITLFDHTIKSVTGSLDFPSEQEKVKVFAKLLEGYYNLFQKTIHLIPENLIQGFVNGRFDEYLRIADFCSVKERVINGSNTKNELKISQNFDVGLAALGSPIVRIHYSYPRTLEEYFTTFHQSMENALSFLSMNLGNNKSILSGRIKEIINIVEKTSISKGANPLISFKNDSIEIVYNVPLYQHGAVFTFNFPLQDKEKPCTLKCAFFAQNEYRRWEMTAWYLAVVAQKTALKMTKEDPLSYKYPNMLSMQAEFSFPLSINDEDLLKPLSLISHRCVDEMCKFLSRENGRGVYEFLYFGSQFNAELTKNKESSVDLWLALDPKICQISLGTNNYMMHLAFNEKKWEQLGLFAAYSLLGLDKKGFEDYIEIAVPRGCSGYEIINNGRSLLKNAGLDGEKSIIGHITSSGGFSFISDEVFDVPEYYFIRPVSGYYLHYLCDNNLLNRESAKNILDILKDPVFKDAEKIKEKLEGIRSCD